MPLIDIFKRASRLVLNLQNSNTTTSYEEGEIVFCKNNVCVHPPTILRQETEIIHHPGYLTISCQSTNKYCGDDYSSNDTTLVLTWIPNATLRKCPSSVEKLSARQSRETSDGFKISPKLDLKTCNRKNSLQSITSFDSQESSLSNSQSAEFKDVDRSNVRVSPTTGHTLKTVSSELNDVCLVESNQEIFCDTSHRISKKYNLQVIMTDDDEVCKIIMEKTNEFRVNDNQDASVQNPLGATLLNENNSRYNFNSNESESSKSEFNELSQISSENTSIQIPAEEGAIYQSEPSLENKLIISLDNININETSELISESNVNSREEIFGRAEIKCETPSSCLSSEKRSDSVKTDVNSTSKDFFSNSDPAHCKEPKNKPDSLEDIHCNKDGENSVRNSPSKFSSLSNSMSSEFTNPTSIDSVSVDIFEKEADALKTSSDCSDTNSCDSSVPMWTYSSEYLNKRRYIPESNTSSPATIRQIQRSCQKFSIDLGEMRSLRLFFSNGDTSSGQLVVASRESQYKILHFHHGGLEKLAKILQEWNRLTNLDPSHKSNLEDVPYRHFMICRPEVNENDTHPEEGKVPLLMEELWLHLLNEVGQIEDPLFLRKSVFFNGLPPQLRRTVWPFLLQTYSYQSTFADRDAINKIRKLEYQEIIRRRSKLTGINKENFTRNVQYVIEKDVVRTDRNNPFYAGDMNPNLDTMKNILLNYAVYDSSLGYLQGMSDLLAPLLVEIGDESETFWCFCGLMQRRLFVCTPTDADMEKNLRYLRELIRIMVPAFYLHLQKHEDAMELLFCHRWILLCFKREFPEVIVFQIWEACWSNYLIDYFHLFVCLAIVAAYAPDVIAQDLRTDEMLLHFSSLAMYMDGTLILKKARWLLYKFRQLLVIPCSLATLCQFSGPGIWDNSHTPSVECLDDPKYCPDTPCPHRGSFAIDN